MRLSAPHKTNKFLPAIIVLFGLFFFLKASAATNNFITSVDVMKFTKDTVANQPSDAQIDAIVSDIMSNLHPEYIAISVPLDDASAYPAGSKPSPRIPVAFAQKWVDTIHAHGAKVIFRGTWSGIEGIYGFQKLVGPNRFPAGTAASAASDGNSTWLGKTYNYILNNPNLFSAGDIWAVLPERTEDIFSDSTSFLGYSGSNIQQTYPQFFEDLNTVSAKAFAKIDKKVTVGMSANNFSEINSGWLSPSLINSDNMIVVDYYGTNHTPQEMETNLTTAYKKYGKPIFLQEWGDYWDTSMSQADRTTYLNSMYAVFRKLADEKILVGLNYWGGWVNNAEGILTQSGNAFGINYRGQLLANFFASLNSSTSINNPTPNPTPVNKPTPVPVPTPSPVPPATLQTPAQPSTPNTTQPISNSAQATSGDSVNLPLSKSQIIPATAQPVAAETNTSNPEIIFLEASAILILISGVAILIEKFCKKH